MPTSHRDAGFTLAEMLLVLAVTAMAAGLVVGRGLPGQSRIDRSALAAFLRSTRAEAMRTAQVLPVVASKDGHTLVAGARGLALGPDRGATSEGDLSFGPDGSSPGALVRIRAPGSEQHMVVQAVTGSGLP